MGKITAPCRIENYLKGSCAGAGGTPGSVAMYATQLKTQLSRAPFDSKLNLTKSHNKDDIRLDNISQMRLYPKGLRIDFPEFWFDSFHQLVVKPTLDKRTIYGLILAYPVILKDETKTGPHPHIIW